MQYVGRRTRGSRRRLVASLVAAFIGLGLAVPASSFALYDFIVNNQWIADSWIPGPHNRMLTAVQGVSPTGDLCVNAVNASNQAWAGQTFCGYNPSHPYCGCVLRRGGGHAYPGTVQLANLTQSY